MPSVNLRPKPSKNKKDRKQQKEMNFEVALRKFKKSVERAGILQKVREKEYYEKPTSKRKRKKQEAVARWRKKERQLSLTGYEQPRRKR